ncbi:ribonuclease H2 subunit B isoform X2 [Tachypleus tridentatus]|uniref:ribonuclease H2 subunit B isoform X2 n=1 Tax=Tachypleus tridentatus TaxID=6853 RepID=UPI003FCFB289
MAVMKQIEGMKNNDSSTQHKIILLPGSGALFGFGPNDSSVYELTQFSEEYRSWFIGECVEQDGILFMMTPFDPLFLVLPYLKQNRSYSPLDQVLRDETYPECKRLLSCIEDNAFQLCDVKEVGGLTALRYNTNKALMWLEQKVENLVRELKVQNVCVSVGSRAATYIPSNKEVEPSNGMYLQYVYELLSEYLSEDIDFQLKSHLGLESNKTEERSADEPPQKRAKMNDAVEPEEDYSVSVTLESKIKTKEHKLTTSQKRLMKVDKTGMKSIQSFFTKTS